MCTSTRKGRKLTCGHTIYGKEHYPVANSDDTFWGSVCGDCMTNLPGYVIRSNWLIHPDAHRKDVVRTAHIHAFDKQWPFEVIAFKAVCFARRNFPEGLRRFISTLSNTPHYWKVFKTRLEMEFRI